MSYIEIIQRLIRSCCTEGLVDTLCYELGFDYETEAALMGEEVDKEAFIHEHRWLPDQYQFKDWYKLEQEISFKVRELKDDEVQLGRFIWEFLAPISDSLVCFYPSRPFTEFTAFQHIVKYLVFSPAYEGIPEPLAKLHEHYVDECLQWGDVDFPPEQRDAKIKELCDNSSDAFRNCNNIPSWGQCTYFKHLFKRLASIIEAALLENNCPLDLFGFQAKYEIVLIPELSPSDLQAERGWSKDYCSKVTRGYMHLDQYTEMAGYGDVGDVATIEGLEVSHFPELDALLKQTNLRGYADFPTYHFARFFDRFQAHCKQLVESPEDTASKKRKVFNLVQILGHCYTTFINTPRLFDYTDYAIRYFVALEAACLKAPEPICLKGMCVDLHYEDLIEDPFPDTTLGKIGYMTNKYERTVSWEQFGLEHILKNSYDFFINQACEKCARAGCSFRNAPSKVPGVSLEKQMPSKKDPDEIFLDVLAAVCKYCEKLVPSIEKMKTRNKEWLMKNNDKLYAYIGAAIKFRYSLDSSPWDQMEDILHGQGSRGYIKGCCSDYLDVLDPSRLEGKTKKAKLTRDDFPTGYHIVDDAIDKLKNGKKRS